MEAVRSERKMRGLAALNGMMHNEPRYGPQAACLVEAEPRAARLGLPALGSSIPKYSLGSLSTIGPRAQSSRLAELGGRAMSFNSCRGTLGSFAMWTATRNASSRMSSFALSRRSGSFSK